MPDDPKVTNIRDSRGVRKRLDELENEVERHDKEILILLTAAFLSIGALAWLGTVLEKEVR